MGKQTATLRSGPRQRQRLHPRLSHLACHLANVQSASWKASDRSAAMGWCCSSYSDACHHSAGKYGYPEGGLSCQETTCLNMGADCYGNNDGCCPGLSCHNMGISGMMCA